MAKNFKLVIEKELEQYKVCEDIKQTYNPFDLTGGGYKKSYRFRFPNGWGASVIKGYGSYGFEEDLWELAVVCYPNPNNPDEFVLNYDNDVTDDVEGYLNDEDVNRLLKEIMRFKDYGA